MKNRERLFIALVIIIALIYGRHSYNQTERQNIQTPKRSVERVYAAEQDKRVEKLEAAFTRYNSPLQGQGETMVRLSDKYGFDYRLLAGIAFTESTLCKNYIRTTYNCWGWGNGKIAYGSFEEAQEAIAYGISTLPYYRKWQASKDNIYELAVPYNAVSPAHWTNTVTYFTKEVE